MSVIKRGVIDESGPLPRLVVEFDDEDFVISIPLTAKSAFRLKRFFDEIGHQDVYDLDFDDETKVLISPDIVGREVPPAWTGSET